MNILHQPGPWVHEGLLLRKLLKKKNMSVVDFRKLMGFSYQSAQYHLRKEAIKRSTLEKFLEKLETDPNEFYGLQQGGKPVHYQFHHGKRLLEMLDKMGFNKTRFAKRLGVTRQKIYELFQTTIFESAMLLQICDTLGISMDHFETPNEMVAEPNVEAPPKEVNYRVKYYRVMEKKYELEELCDLLTAEKNSLQQALQTLQVANKSLQQELSQLRKKN
ncbi:hypothetical protein COR50_03020 [Chitinophaga caeni]|uniref:HTH cro/C1-type domain-containing protein n=1 Tax=Chitinophaga caeni TaxID=2029983 RepID=A0A291QQM7_9BACT|nr:helix-turn-helix transcriptional regulator [Chitinophaga caeni]ATL46221.1 hypothetical protein COR50_03020 [Chitinophaga caeni]